MLLSTSDAVSVVAWAPRCSHERPRILRGGVPGRACRVLGVQWHIAQPRTQARIGQIILTSCPKPTSLNMLSEVLGKASELDVRRYSAVVLVTQIYRGWLLAVSLLVPDISICKLDCFYSNLSTLEMGLDDYTIRIVKERERDIDDWIQKSVV
jgi:hypothetical protein